ncbi:MAG TPA: hypothetical protein ENK57_11980 [Polyangiaceae bacterium]|nr:hypothetical protein [Polyangiaceae bacterium]
MNLSDTQRSWLKTNGIKAERHYEGFRFFRPSAHGYALGSVVIARPKVGGGLLVEMRAASEWDRATACYVGRSKNVATLRAALGELCAEPVARVA